MDWVRQAPGLCHSCTKKLSHSHSFIKIKCNLQWSWQLSSQVTNQPVMVRPDQMNIAMQLVKGRVKNNDEWWSLVSSMRDPGPQHLQKDVSQGRRAPQAVCSFVLHLMCSWMGTAGKHNCCVLDLCNTASQSKREEWLNQHLEWHTEADQS